MCWPQHLQYHQKEERESQKQEAKLVRLQECDGHNTYNTIRREREIERKARSKAGETARMCWPQHLQYHQKEERESKARSKAGETARM